MADHPLFAAVYDRVSKAADAAGLARRRRRLLSQARGRVLDVGAGTGLNLAHYGTDVTSVVALEPDGAMRVRLEDRLRSVPPEVDVEVVPSSLEDAPLEPGSFDTVVCTLVLCTVEDLASALERIGDLLVDGGQLLFLEHVRAVGGRARLQSAATPVWRKLAAGCRLDRDTPNAIRDARFVVTDLERFRMSRFDPFTGVMVQGRAQRKVAA